MQNHEEDSLRFHSEDDTAHCSITPLSHTKLLNHDLSKENMSAAYEELAAVVGAENVVSDRETLQAHSSTPWSPSPPSQSPHLVVLPSNTSEAKAIMRICSKRKVPAVGYSGGTSFSGALTATRGGICIDFNRMNKIIAVHAEDLDVVVQPAVGWQSLNAVLEQQSLFFPPDPGPGAKIGGMVRMDHSICLYFEG